MPYGKYLRTQKARDNMSLAQMGHKNNLGKTHSVEAKMKMRLKKLGIKLSDEHKEKIRLKVLGNKSRTGQHLSKETKLKMSEQRKGPKHWNWRGGISKENTKIRLGIEYGLWRNAVYARDGYTCQKYGTKGKDLVAHHVLNFSKYPELRLAIDNGVTLSIKAHKEFHSRYGKKNNTWDQLNEFILETLCQK